LCGEAALPGQAVVSALPDAANRTYYFQLDLITQGPMGKGGTQICPSNSYRVTRAEFLFRSIWATPSNAEILDRFSSCPGTAILFLPWFYCVKKKGYSLLYSRI
jgi:hypothetical protein